MEEAVRQRASGMLQQRAGLVNLKVVLVGAISVGKTSIVQRFTRNIFSHALDSTIGASYQAAERTVGGHRFLFSVWDTAGQEAYHSLVPMYFRDATAVILVYASNSAQSFADAQEWLTDVRRHAPENVIVAVAGNKADLAAERAVSFEDGDAFAASVGGVFVETSAATGDGVVDLFEQIAMRVIDRGLAEPPPAAPEGTQEPADGDAAGRVHLDAEASSGRRPGPRRKCC
eukprot:TRINITY_DN59621_c0_g1_i1.p1 TRINITY_DN59621_c0_g1~~TRINITY_DN59621_c0_g1_i1.p1  ORF type:complete len:230 (+),score=39.49 TRINITY_DN59621_c0_g1_i1:190-879(+)